MEHSGEIIYVKRPALCTHCSDYIWGVKLYGIQCSKCFKCFHPSCFQLSTIPCDEEPIANPPFTSSTPISLSSWTVQDVGNWMAVVSLYRYYEVFKKYKVGGSELEALTREQLQEMRIEDSFHIDSIIVASDVLKNRENDDDDDATTTSAHYSTNNNNHNKHHLSTFSFMSSQHCHVCNSHLLGIIQQGLQCRVCGLCCHRRCRVLRLPECHEGCVKRRGSFIQDGTFGKSLDHFSSIPPPIILLTTQEMRQRASKENACLLKFYRQTPCTQAVLQLKEEIQQNSADVYRVSLGRHSLGAIGGIVKKFLRDLPEPVVPESFYSDFIAIIGEQHSPLQSKELLSRLPPTHYLTLEHLINHLTSDNDPELKKLAHIFGNILLRPPWHQILDIVHNSKIQSQTVNHLMTYRSVLFTRELHQAKQQQLSCTPPDLPPRPHSTTTPSPSPSSLLANQPWYFGDITREEVDDLMMTAMDGSFLVRNAANWDPSEPYTLTLRKNGTNKLIKISKVRSQFGLSKNPPLFPTLQDLINHYSTHSLSSFNRDLDVNLRHPLTRERLTEQHSVVDLQKIREEFKEICSESIVLMGNMEALNSEHDTLADLIRVYQNKIEAIKKVILAYAEQLETSKRFVKERTCNKEMKKRAIDGQKKIEMKKKGFVETLARVENKTIETKERLSAISQKLESMKKKMVLLDMQKEEKKRSLIELKETEINIDLLQSGSDVQKNLPHHQVHTWFVVGDRSRANELLEGKCRGTFLIRPREEERNHALSIVSQNNEVVHCVIERMDSGYGFVDPYFIHRTLLDLVLHYKDTSLKEHNDTLEVTLDFPALA